MGVLEVECTICITIYLSSDRLHINVSLSSYLSKLLNATAELKSYACHIHYRARETCVYSKFCVRSRHAEASSAPRTRNSPVANADLHHPMLGM